MRFLITAICLFPVMAFAQQDFPRDVEVCWDNPDSFVDNTLMEPGDLENIRIEAYRQNDTVPAFTATIPANGQGLRQCSTFTAAVPNPGTYRFEGYAIVIGGIESDASESAFKKYVGKPRSVTIITVE